MRNYGLDLSERGELVTFSSENRNQDRVFWMDVDRGFDQQMGSANAVRSDFPRNSCQEHPTRYPPSQRAGIGCRKRPIKGSIACDGVSRRRNMSIDSGSVSFS